jgi:hemolysin D
MKWVDADCAAPEFLSPLGELIATRPSRAARRLLLALLMMPIGLLTWAAVAQVEVVARAPGRLLPAQGSHAIQPLEAGRVVVIRVREGQQVQAGEVLLELDPSAVATAHARLNDELAALEFERWRLRSLLAATAGRDAPAVAAPPLAGTGARRQLALELAAWHAAEAAAAARAREKRAELRALSARLAGLRAAQPLIEEVGEAHRRLAAQGVIARVAWLGEERARLAARREIDELAARRLGLRAALAAETAQAREQRAARRGTWATQLAASATRAVAVAAEIGHARRRLSAATLRAPVAGTVWQVNPLLRPGVVAPAEPLLLVVPEDARLEAAVEVANRDIAAVQPGQRAWLKIEAFPFTRHGALAGQVTAVARDAAPTDASDARYRVRIALAEGSQDDRLPVHRLVAGMAVTAEFRIGRRRILDFLLAPLQRTLQESLRER